nr:hypothetical protein [Bryobacterales bacterium]
MSSKISAVVAASGLPQSRCFWLLATFLFSCVAIAPAQRVEVGGIVGWSPNPPFQPTRVAANSPLGFGFPFESSSNTWFGGPTIAVRIQPRLYLSLDALAKPLSFDVFNPDANGNLVQRSTTNIYTVQFPVLARYHFTSGAVQPFLEGGPSFRVGDRGTLVQPSGYGFTAGAGLRFRSRGVAIMPRVRYTRWAADPTDARVRTRQDQVEILLSVTDHGNEDTKPLGRRVSLGATVGSYLGDQSMSNTVELANPLGPGTATNRFDFSSRPFFLGPVVQVELTSRISVEVNALMRSYRWNLTTTLSDNASGFQQSQSSRVGPYTRWEVPLLGRYRFGDGPVQPFVMAGASFREGRRHTYGQGSRFGFTTGGGVEIPWK